MQNLLTQDIRHKACPYQTTCLNKTDRCRAEQMNTAKVLIPNKEWVITHNQKKIGAITKDKKGYTFHKNGKSVDFENLNEAKDRLGIEIFEDIIKRPKKDLDQKSHYIYDYPCRTKPYEPVYNVKNRLPLFAKSPKSKSRYCAGYYIICRDKHWATSFCPKLITVQRYPYFGPFKTKEEMKAKLHSIETL